MNKKEIIIIEKINDKIINYNKHNKNKIKVNFFEIFIFF
jgi:hypothetical protein